MRDILYFYKRIYSDKHIIKIVAIWGLFRTFTPN